MGRSTEYKEEYIQKATEYLKSCQDKVYKNKLKVSLPTIEGFAQFIGVHKDTLYAWSKEQPEFSDSLTKIKTEQQQRLLNKGLSNDYNPTIAKLILSSNHGMREKSDVTSDDKPIFEGVEISIRK